MDLLSKILTSKFRMKAVCKEIPREKFTCCSLKVDHRTVFWHQGWHWSMLRKGERLAEWRLKTWSSNPWHLFGESIESSHIHYWMHSANLQNKMTTSINHHDLLFNGSSCQSNRFWRKLHWYLNWYFDIESKRRNAVFAMELAITSAFDLESSFFDSFVTLFDCN